MWQQGVLAKRPWTSRYSVIVQERIVVRVVFMLITGRGGSRTHVSHSALAWQYYSSLEINMPVLGQHLPSCGGCQLSIRYQEGMQKCYWCLRYWFSSKHRQMSISGCYEKVKTFKYLGYLVANQNSIQDQIKCRLKAGNSCYYSVQNLFFFLLDSSLRTLKLKYVKW